jgi:hypothetical protein
MMSKYVAQAGSWFRRSFVVISTSMLDFNLVGQYTFIDRHERGNSLSEVESCNDSTKKREVLTISTKYLIEGYVSTQNHTQAYAPRINN